MTLFHVTAHNFAVGSLIEPGRHGKIYRDAHPYRLMPFTPQGMAELFWETALEASRVGGFGNKPSRLSCIFASDTIEAARAFLASRRPGARILIVQPLSPDTSFHRGGMNLLSATPEGTAFLDHLAAQAIRYWRDDPQEAVEVLIGGPVVVTGVAEQYG